MIKNVVFDMGNVLLDYNPDVSLNLFCKTHSAKQQIRKELFGGKEWVQRDLGLISKDELFCGCAQRVDEEYHAQLKACVDNWHICMQPLPGAVDFVSFVRENGYGVYLLSNASEEFYDYFPEQIDVNLFDGIVVSADIHLVKPEKEIYHHLLCKYSLNARECLFVDDREDNVSGARAVGMNAVRFENDFESIKLLLAENFS